MPPATAVSMPGYFMAGGFVAFISQYVTLVNVTIAATSLPFTMFLAGF
jgi:hypothetical protein